MKPHLRIARPVADLERSSRMYRQGLGLDELGRFVNHGGFDGVMLGNPGRDFHFEFTHRRDPPVKPQPTPEDLLVYYLPDRRGWDRACAKLLAAGFVDVPPLNPFWQRKGRTFQDPDGYRVVIQRERPFSSVARQS